MADINEHDNCGCGCGHDHSHDHDECGCGHDHSHNTMKLVLEDGSEMECTVIDVFDLDEDRAYIALLPIGDDEVLLYKYVENEDESFELLNIETDEEFAEVEEAFFSMFDSDDFDGDEELFDDGEEYEYEDEVDDDEE